MANNVKLLSGKQLMETGGRKSDSFLPTKGAKSVVPSGTWLEKKQIESALEARKCVLEWQRVEKRSTLTQAEWQDDKQKALVTGKKGSQWLHMGQIINQQLYLLPEETLHLMEMNSLELKYYGVPVSIQQAYCLLIGKSLSLNEYRVYSLLSKQGYKLIRYDETRQYAKCGDSDSSKADTSNILGSKDRTGGEDNICITKDSDDCDPVNLINSEGNENNNLQDFSENQLNKSDIEIDKEIIDDAIEMCVEPVLIVEENDGSVINESESNIEDINNQTCMDIDSSSDDCMVVDDSNCNQPICNGDANNLDSEINVCSSLSHDSDPVEVECLPSFSLKLNILDSIPNCYHKNVMYLKAPDKKYIPPDITLHKNNYLLVLNKLSNKSNMNDVDSNGVNFYDEASNSRNPMLKCITNYSHQDAARSNSQTQNSRNVNSHFVGRNNFANNMYFWNHIFHQLSSRQANFLNNFQFPHMNGMFGRVNSFSNNFGQRPFFFTQFNSRPRFAPNFFFQPFSMFCSRSNAFPSNNLGHNYPNYNSCSSERENNFSQMFSARNSNAQSQSNPSHRKRCRNQTNHCYKCKISPPENVHYSRPPETASSGTNISKESIFRQIKALISRYSIISPNEQSDDLRKALKLSVDKFNQKFNEDYTLDFKTPQCLLKKISNHSNMCQEVPLTNAKRCLTTVENDKVLQLSSDSDCSPCKVSRLKNNYSPSSDSRVKRRVKRKLRTKRSQSESKLTFQVNTSYSSSDSEFDVCSLSNDKIEQNGDQLGKIISKDSETNPKETGNSYVETIPRSKKKVVCDHSKDASIFGTWYPKKDSWNRPVYSQKKPRHIHIASSNLKISYAILNNVRELSYEKDWLIQSWGQAKRLFQRKRDSGTVCISDDESTPNDATESRLNDITIKIDKTHPLVRPEDCKSVSTVLERLQILNSAYDDQKLFGSAAKGDDRLKISYDMYLPSFKTLRKSDLPHPSFSIVVLGDTTPIPSPAALSRVSESLPTSVPFLLGIVTFDAVSFIQMEHIDLPNLMRSREDT